MVLRSLANLARMVLFHSNFGCLQFLARIVALSERFAKFTGSDVHSHSREIVVPAVRVPETEPCFFGAEGFAGGRLHEGW